jgi:hypothetical protein
MLGESYRGAAETAIVGGWWLFATPSSLPEAIARMSDTSLLPDDSAVPDPWGRPPARVMAGHTAGGLLHELGHTWGLANAADPLDMMGRGMDVFYRAFALDEAARPGWSAADTAILRRSAWLAPGGWIQRWHVLRRARGADGLVERLALAAEAAHLPLVDMEAPGPSSPVRFAHRTLVVERARNIRLVAAGTARVRLEDASGPPLALAD